jgi:hypothetical protein
MLGNTLNLGHFENHGLLAFGLGGEYFENALAIGHYPTCKAPSFFHLCKFRYLSCPKIFVTTCHSNFCGPEGEFASLTKELPLLRGYPPSLAFQNMIFKTLTITIFQYFKILF